MDIVIFLWLQSGLRVVVIISLIGLDLLHGWEEYVVDSVFDKVLVPHFSFLLTDQIALIDQKKWPFLLVYFFHIFLQVFTSKEERVSAIHNLNDHVGSVNDSPKLFPDFDVLFVGGDLYFGIFLFDKSQCSSPVEVRLSFFLFELFLVQVFPIGSSWNLKFVQ